MLTTVGAFNNLRRATAGNLNQCTTYYTPLAKPLNSDLVVSLPLLLVKLNKTEHRNQNFDER